MNMSIYKKTETNSAVQISYTTLVMHKGTQ